MTKAELEERISKGVTDEDYNVIEFVYTFHPSIDEVEGKNQIAMLYDVFGMRVIKDMVPTAEKAKAYEESIRAVRLELNGLQDAYKRFTIGEC